MKVGIAGPILVAPFADRLGVSPPQLKNLPVGLGGTPVINLVQGLLHRGHDVVVFTLDPAVTDEVVLQGDQLKMCIGPYRRRHRARDLFAAERAYLRQACRRERPEVMHAHWTYEFALAALDSSLPTLVTAHDAPFRCLGFRPDAYRAVRTWMALMVARKARNMTAVSGHVEGHFRSFLRYRGKMEVVPNAVPEAAFAFRKQRIARSRNGRITFATVLTGWSKLKNGKTALLAFRRLRKDLPQAALWMFGNGHGPAEDAAEWARRNDCAEGVVFRGMIPYEELFGTLAGGVDILVHPAREESFAMPVAEGLALGIPVIAGENTGGVPEVLERGGVGLLTDISSPVRLSEAMLQLATNRRWCDQLGELGAFSAQRFTQNAVAARYESILRGLP